jgi:hypothetical protein
MRANIRPMHTQHVTMQGPAVYRVRVQGNVPIVWSTCLMGMNITVSSDDESTLVGRLPDQAALSGVLGTLYDKQYPVLSVECLEIG